MQRGEKSLRRVRAELAGTVVADSTTPLLVWLREYPTTYGFPLADVRTEFLRETVAADGRQWFDLVVGERVIERAAWSTRDGEFAGYLVVEWGAVDRWREEEEELRGHPRDPYVRIDTLPSSRHVQIRVAGYLLADSVRPRVLFETGKPTRYYLPAEDVRLDRLVDSTTTSYCPYKGMARYHSVVLDGTRLTDLVWSYPDPLPEVATIVDLLAFFDEQVDVTVDGVLQERPTTAWS